MKKIGILKAMRLCAAYEKMDAAQREALRERRLRALVAHARENSPFYKELYRDLPEDFRLSDLPPTDKRTLMARWDDWVCDRELTLAEAEKFMEDRGNIGAWLKGRYLVFTTSGSTGNPLVAVCDRTANSVMGGISARRSFARKEDLSAFMRRGRKSIGVFADEGLFQPRGDRYESGQQFGAVGNGEFRRVGRSGGAQIGDKVAYREVGLVSDRRDHRDPGRCDRPCERLVVEAKQILKRSPAPPDDDQVDIVPRIETADPVGKFRGRARPLYGGGNDQDLRGRESPFKDAEHIADRGACRRRDDPDLLRVLRQRFLPIGVEQPLGLELGAQFLVREKERADPVARERVDVKLVFPVLRVERDAPPRDDREPVRQRELHELRPRTEHHAADQPVAVLQREIEMPGLRLREIGDRRGPRPTAERRRNQAAS